MAVISERDRAVSFLHKVYLLYSASTRYQLKFNIFMTSKDQLRQQANLQFLNQGKNFSFGDISQCPLPLVELAQLNANSANVEATLSGGLTAVVYKLRVAGRCYAIKQARPECLVRNDDGKTSFLNELQRHAEIRELRAEGAMFPGVIAPIYGDLQAGVIVSDWIDGDRVATFNRRQLTQVFAAGRALVEQGFFEWDYCAGNILDDGAQTWLFDFGYMYRFDALRECNSAGDGTNVPLFHLAERIESRNAFSWLLDVESAAGTAAALDHFRMVKEVALDCYQQWHNNRAARGASAFVLDWISGYMRTWGRAMAGDADDLRALYFAEAWRSHTFDLNDDLHGQSCTQKTLLRADWLIDAVRTGHAQLQASGALSASDAALSPPQLLAHYQQSRLQAEAFLLK